VVVEQEPVDVPAGAKLFVVVLPEPLDRLGRALAIPDAHEAVAMPGDESRLADSQLALDQPEGRLPVERPYEASEGHEVELLEQQRLLESVELLDETAAAADRLREAEGGLRRLLPIPDAQEVHPDAGNVTRLAPGDALVRDQVLFSHPSERPLVPSEARGADALGGDGRRRVQALAGVVRLG
jgi:hypothetical protein